jgi:glyoxylase-like metal-dependent hydrolase (beta-lactamase superfamily II)
MDYPGGKTEFVLSPEVTVYPIRAATSPPFQHTNLVVLLRRTERAAVVVDPGGNDEAALATALKRIPAGLSLFVVITHKHADHWASLEQVRASWPEGTLCGSRECLSKVGGAEAWKKTLYFPMDRESAVAGLRVVPTPGHTDGDVSVVDAETGLACVGDHCVGVGSSLLDADCGERGVVSALPTHLAQPR